MLGHAVNLSSPVYVLREEHLSSPRLPHASLPTISSTLAPWFVWYVKKYQVGKFFHATRLLRDGKPTTVAMDEPLIVYLNHPSWWDPLLCVVASELFPGRTHYAPIDAAMLAKYKIFARLGFFGVDPGPKGALQFLRTSRAVLSQPRAMLWLTAQGEFRDVRVRPPGLKGGLSTLLTRLDRATVLPLAVEYPFWNEKKPEAHLSFGGPLIIGQQPERVEVWADRLESALAQTQDQLAQASIARDPKAFDVLLHGRSGVGGVYDLWGWLKAVVKRRRYVAGHEPPSA